MGNGIKFYPPFDSKYLCEHAQFFTAIKLLLFSVGNWLTAPGTFNCRVISEIKVYMKNYPQSILLTGNIIVTSYGK